MAHRKRRVFQHVMESDSISLIKEYLPSEWVIREYSPDYGIDLVVEVFECVDAERKVYEALGEMLFAQVKEQLSREPRELPTLKINPEKTSIFDIELEDLTIEGYNPHSAIKAPIAV